MPIALYRIDDRLIHGQVVVGWGQPLELRFIVLIDDAVADSEWEQELYRMGVPPEMQVHFHDVASAAEALAHYESEPRPGMVLVADVHTMLRLAQASPLVRSVNIGGVHHAPGRTPRLRYVFLSPDEEAGLQAIERRGVTVTAQDVPATKPVPLSELLAAHADS